MRSGMKLAAGGLALVSAMIATQARALVVDSGPVSIPINATAAGTYLNLVDGGSASTAWDFHARANGGGGLAFEAVAGAKLVLDGATPKALGEGMRISVSSSFAASGTLDATAFRTGGVHVVGVAFTDEVAAHASLGYVQVATTSPTGFPATILRYAYETDAGVNIVVPGDSRLFASDFEAVFAAADCSANAVQAALSGASDGATVTIPSGDCNWGTDTVTRNAGIRIRGAGRELTTIRRTVPVADGDDDSYLLEIDCTNGKQVELSGIAFVGNDDEQTEDQRLHDADNGVVLKNGCIDFKVHDMTFSKFSDSGLTIRGNPQRGVVYRSDFLSNFKCQPDPVDCLGYGVTVYGNNVPPPLSLGSRNAVFVEDNYFHDNRHNIASNYGSQYVFRHNTAVSTQRTRDFGMIDAHGHQETTLIGSRSWEIYANMLKPDPASMVVTGIGIRGGDGVIFGNILRNIPHAAWLSNESCSGPYPLQDQIRAAYIWDNDWHTIPGYGTNAVEIASGCEPYLVEGRDYFLTPMPGYAPYAYPHPLR